MKLYDYTHNKSGAKGTWNEDQYQTVKGRDWLGKYTVVERVVRGEGQHFMPEALKRLQLDPSKDIAAVPEMVEKTKNKPAKKETN